VSWYSKKQSIVALSSTEAEYVAASKECKDLIWLERFISELLDLKVKTVVLHMDNQSAITLGQAVGTNERTKHIDVRYHYLQDLCSKELVKIKLEK